MRRKCLLVVAFAAHLLIRINADAVEVTAGAARIDLTPPSEMNVALGGYGERMSRPAVGVHDRVLAKALVVSDGRRRVAVLTADILGFPPAFKPELVRRLSNDGWTSQQILLLPSHSHTSIDMNAINRANVFDNKQIGIFDERLLRWTIQRCAAVIEMAASELVPVTIGTTANAIDGWNRNRRRRDGPVDASLTVTRIDVAEVGPLAVLVNFTAHPTFMGAEHMLVSGGWPGHLQRELERAIGPRVIAMYYNGAEGDQSPVARPGSGSNRWQAAEKYGQELALEAHQVWRTITPLRDVEFDYHLEPIELPDRSWHPAFMKTGGDEYGLSKQLLKEMLPVMFPAKTTSSSLRLGDLVMVGVPGEMTAELGIRIKSKAAEITGARHIVIGGLANEWISYILSEQDYELGGYETSVSFYGPDLGRAIVDGALIGVKQLQQ